MATMAECRDCYLIMLAAERSNFIDKPLVTRKEKPTAEAALREQLPAE